MAKAGDGKERSAQRRRHHLLQKRVDNDELDAFIRRAHNAGFDDHREYLSALILGDNVIAARDRSDLIRALGELGKHGSNLNQIARAINAGHLTSISQTETRIIADTKNALKAVAAEIREALK